jgi:hypothetical protein
MKYSTIALLAIFLVFQSCNSSRIKEEQEKIERSESFIKDQFIVQFVDDEGMKQVVSKYARYELKVIDAVNETNHTYVLSYDTLAIEPAKMKVRLEKQKDVQMLEFNKKLKLRKRGR